MNGLISLVSVYNNDELLNEMIVSLSKQKDIEVERIFLDNKNGKFSSAAKALNYGIDHSTGEVLVFLHQDIEFLDSYVLKNIYDFVIDNKDKIVGAAGVKSKETDKTSQVFSAMCEGEGKSRYTTLNVPTRAFVLDECLIACHRDCFKKIRFDEELCDGWHLYGADLCLQAINFAGFSVYVLPMNIYHKSHGNADKSYFKTQNKLAKKYRNYYKIINTTNSYVFTNSIKRLLQNLYRKVKYNQ